MAFNLADLSGFTGSETAYRHALVRSVVYTDGVKYLAEGAGAYWLLDFIATHQLDPRFKSQDFQVWKLKTATDGNRASLVCEDGNDGVFFEHELEFTDFPEPGVTLWFTNGVILLPSEY